MYDFAVTMNVLRVKKERERERVDMANTKEITLLLDFFSKTFDVY